MARTAAKHHPIEVQAESLELCLYEVKVRVPAPRIAQEFDHVYQAAGRRVKMPGFRPGKVPVSVLRQVLGDSIEKDAKGHLFEHVINDALAQLEMDVLRVKDFDPSQHEVSEDEELEFSFEVETAPEVELSDWSEVEVQAESTQPTEDQLEGALDSLGREHVRFDDTDEALDDEHVAECDLLYKKDGEDGPTAEGLRLTLEAPLYGSDSDQYQELMEGAKAGDEIEVPIVFNEGFTKEDWIGEKGTAIVQVKRIASPRPATPDEVAEDLQLDSREKLEEAIQQQLSRDNEARERNRQSHEVLQRLFDLKPFDLPDRMIEEEVEASLKSHTERLEKQGGLSPEEAKGEAERVVDEIRDDSMLRLRHFFLIRKVADTEKVRVTNNDLDQAFRALAQRHQTDVKTLKAYYDEQNMTGGLRRDILENKVRRHLLDKAKIVAVQTEEE